MKINLNDPKEFTVENVRTLIASEDDTVHTQFRVTKDGFLFLSQDVGNRNLEGIVFRLETNGAFNGYVGENASMDDSWVTRVFNVVNENWPKPKFPYCDNF
ncbi:hypothetical protein [Algoriphagus sp. NG3]|uniref:hypothetical protein n=1 Tax=Algoriphagus sp. NG3 TaxID=3097546 RepID=UPI002A7FAE35|nr:hypothetical protein [Algoriphagus sp. NG3]WPR76019.1 hypothetical protein SLW71_01485 [Algoriphagus sp. NG3]